MNMANIQENDWVMTRTPDGALVQGWVNITNGYSAEIYITSSEIDTLVGRIIKFRVDDLKKMDDFKLVDEGGILNLIDMALDERNKEEFLVLTEKLQSLKQNKVAV